MSAKRLQVHPNEHHYCYDLRNRRFDRNIFDPNRGPYPAINQFAPGYNLTEMQPTDLVNQSIPFSYLSVEVVANDGNPHQVQLYTDISGEWLAQSDLIKWQTTVGATVSHQLSLQNQTQFLEVDGRPRYGSVMYSTQQVCGSSFCNSVGEFIDTLQVSGMTYEVAQDTIIRPAFVSTGVLNNTVDSQFRAINSNWPVFAFTHNLGVVGTTTTSPVVYNVGYVRDPLVQFLNVPNANSQRSAYYLTRYSNVSDMVCPFNTSNLQDAYVSPPGQHAPRRLPKRIGARDQF